MGIMRFATRLRPICAILGLALCLGALLACPGCVDYQGNVPCESDSDCGRAQACDLTQGICRPMSCVLACQGRECGPDGCGGTCGACAAGETCSQGGQCLGACSPDCSARECGPDGCGGSCGTCPAGEACTPVGVCGGDYPCCETRECGPDPCMGVSCGACLPGETCTPGGMCEGDYPCCGIRECGPDPCAGAPCGTCGMDEWCDTSGQCQGVCTPDCTGKSCGDDGCGGSCGTCAYDEWCSAASQCRAAAQVGEACPFESINPDAGVCAEGLTCLGLAPEPYSSPCSADEDCLLYLQDFHNPDCSDGGCGGSFCVADCVAEDCDSGFSPQMVGGHCYCIPANAGPNDGQVGDACYFDPVHTEEGACVPGLECFGMGPYWNEMPCTDDSDCLAFLPASYNPECVAGSCGASLCVGPCAADGSCADGLQPIVMGSECFCIPSDQIGTGQPGDPCPFEQVHADDGPCAPDLVCLGNAQGAEACATVADCVNFGYDQVYNPECVQGFCGFSFCAGLCVNGGHCDPGFLPIESEGTCYCIPDTSEATGQAGDPCPFDQVNPTATECAVGLTCLGILPDPSSTPCPAGDADCLAFYAAAWNPDCAVGGCGVSFCSATCTNGACPAGFGTYDIMDTCYCIPLQQPSPSRIAYVTNRSGRYEIWVMTGDGLGQRQLTFSAPDETQRMGAHSPRWSPDGARIAFLYGAGDPTPDSTRTMVMNADGTDLREVTHAIRTYWELIAWSLDGTAILQELDLFMNSQILGVDLATGATRVVLDDTPDGYLIAVSPDVNPVDATLAYIAYNTGGDWGGLRLRAMDGGAETTLLGAGVGVASPRWSPTGEEIAYSLEDSTTGSFKVIARAGGPPRTITLDPPVDTRAVSVDWTEDGFIFRRSAGSGGEIWACGADGSGAHALLADGWNNLEPDWRSAP